MRQLFIQFANLTVMVHMAFGCAWHHGITASHTCIARKTCLAGKATVKSSCAGKPDSCRSKTNCCGVSATHIQETVGQNAGHDYDGHEHGEQDHQVDAACTGRFYFSGTSAVPGCDGNHSHDHSTCQNDRCSFKPVVAFDLQQLVDVDEYRGCASATVIQLNSVRVSSNSLDKFLPCRNVAPEMRAYLYLCVMIL